MDTITKLTNLLSILNENQADATMPVTAPLPTSGVLSIVVADRGWVYIGKVEQEADWLTVIDARQITRWGTTKGLNELVDGPTSTTRLGAPASIRIPMRAVITVIPVVASKWEGK